MRNLLLVMKLDLFGSFRSKWFIGYASVFILIVTLVFATGVTDSRVMGFTGLTRMLLVFIQACNIILPIFILVTTVRTISGERENNTLEYLLSFPVSLNSYYWGKFIGRFLVVFLPMIFALILACLIGLFKGGDIPYSLFFLYVGLLGFNSLAFLGIGFFISSLIKNQEFAVGAALFVWLLLIAFIDIALIGFMLKNMVPDTIIFSAALLNPVQVFRLGAITLFDPVLSVIGPSSYFILDNLGRAGCIAYALIYPAILGMIFAVSGCILFKRKDLV